jgi:carboxyl-terminal processing protease
MAIASFVRAVGGSRTAVAGGFFLLLLAAGGWLVQRGTRDTQPSVYETARLFEEVRQHISRDFVDSLSEDALYRRAVDGVLYELNDPYTRFLPLDRLERLAETTSGNYVGVGLEIDRRDEWIVVMAPRPGSPAERAGFQPGDRIVEIDGRSTEDMTLEETSNALRGPVASRVTLAVDRAGASRTFRITLTRARVHVSAVRRAEMLTRDVGYVELRSFTDSTVAEVERAVDALRGRGMRSLVLDLRTNPGGLLDQGVRVADLFLDQGVPIMRTHARAPAESRTYTDNAPQRWPDLPVTVLVDGRSASATEIVAGALQDHDRAAIVGAPTYGKGSAQTIFRLTGGGLKMTTARWYTPVGRSIARATPRESDFDISDEPPPSRPRFRTLGGRMVFGGGGIVPDVVAGDTAPDLQEAALNALLAGRAQTFLGALTDVANAARRGRLVTSPDFPVTSELLEMLYDRLQARGIDIPRVVFDDAEGVVTRLLTYEIARVVFGSDAEFRRRAADDTALRAALRLASGATSPRDPLRRIAGPVRDRPADPSG